MKKNNVQVRNAVAAAITMAIVAIVLIISLTTSTEVVYANTDHGEAKDQEYVNSFVEENLNDETSAQGEISTPVTPADPATKPDNGLMNLDEMYAYEPHIEKTEDKLDELPPEELLEELEKIFNPVYGDVEAAVTADTLVEAINSINNDRFEAAKENAGKNTDSDVGESQYEKAETTTASTTIAETNGITSVSEPSVSDTIIVGVNSYEKKDDTATKTVARIYCPDGSSYQMELTTDNYNLIDLVGEDGDYVINIYQCNGDGYTHVSQHEVTKGEKPEQTQETENTEKSTSSFRSSKRNEESSDKEDTSKVESSDNTTVKTPDTTPSIENSVDTSVTNTNTNKVSEPVETPDEEAVAASTENNEDNNNQSDIADSNDSAESTESIEATESSDDSASDDSTADDADKEFNETETSMTMDQLLGMLGGF